VVLLLVSVFGMSIWALTIHKRDDRRRKRSPLLEFCLCQLNATELSFWIRPAALRLFVGAVLRMGWFETRI